MKTRFEKGQKVYKLWLNGWSSIEENNTTTQTVAITEHTVDGCGLKRLTLFDDITYTKQFRPNSMVGIWGDEILMFYASKEEAETEMNKWIERNNGYEQRGHKYFYNYKENAK